MCEFISFVVCEDGRLLANNLSAHEGIEALHNLKPGTYRECEWTGESEDTLTFRLEEGETKGEWLSYVLSRFSKRIDLLNWFLANPVAVGGWLDLRGLTSAKGLKLPKTVGRWLDLCGLTFAERKAIKAQGYKVY